MPHRVKEVGTCFGGVGWRDMLWRGWLGQVRLAMIRQTVIRQTGNRRIDYYSQTVIVKLSVDKAPCRQIDMVSTYVA